jgi:hypothetical protein
MSIIQAAGSGEVSTGFYDHLLDQSLKFDDGKSSALTRTPASAGNQRLWTFSAWAKKSTLDIDGYLLGIGSSSTPEFIKISNSSTDQFEYAYWNGSVYVYQVRATALLRDTSAWYHIVLAVDTAQGTAANRVKFYVNGTQLTDFSISTYPTQNADTRTNAAVEHRIGSVNGGGYYDGYIAEVNFIDGAALTPSSFGETKDGIWIPKDTSGLTFGTNGFHLTFKDDVVSEGFNTVTYSGNGLSSGQSISGLGLSPDLVWIKERTNTSAHVLIDTVRGANIALESNNTNANFTPSSVGLASFDADGFTIGSDNGAYNSGSDPDVGWCWEAGGAPTADNSAGAGATPTAGSVKIDGSNLGSALAGSIAATRLSANTSQGFSIGTFTKGSGTETVAHGLGAAPDWLIVKRTNGTGSWAIYHSGNTANPETDYLRLNSDGATADDATFWGDTAPTSTVFSIGAAFNSGEELVFYAWTDISGYSKFDSYSGTGSSHSVTLGFRPAFLMVKRTDAANEWHIIDSTRQPSNPNDTFLFANTTAVENTGDNAITLTATGFTPTSSNGRTNASGGTYIYMAFADTREAAFFKDVSTNGNHFTPVNLDYRDSVPDTPTNNFCTANPLHKRLDGTVTISEGNLQISAGSSYGGDNRFAGTTAVSSGKWYFEMLRTDATGLGNQTATGVFDADTALSSGAYSGNGTNSGAASNEWALTDRGYACNTSTYTNLSGTIGTVAQNKVVQVAVDMDNKKIWFGIDNTFSGDPAAGSGEAFSNLPTTILPMLYTAQSTQVFNFGQDSSFSGLKATANSNADGNGHGSFAYAPPSGYLALCSQNLPDVDIIDGTEYFNTVTYTGTGATTLSITGVGFQPDWVWAKKRSASDNHGVADTVRGATETLFPNTDSAESTDANGLKSFDSDGFTIGSGSGSGIWGGNSGATYVAWNWKINAGTSSNVSAGGSSNIRLIGAGTADQAAVQANTTAGISIVSFENTVRAADGFCTFPHGLGSAPDMVWLKSRTSSNYWAIYHSALGLNLGFLGDSLGSNAFISSTYWNAVSSSTVKFQSNGNLSATDEDIIAYCFKSIEGYSRAGSYTGNGDADGNFIYTGFRPAWILIKNATDNSEDWEIHDATRDPFNVTTKRLKANTNGAEVASTFLDFVSNGVKLRSTGGGYNSSGKTFIYLAFAEQPFKFANAR